MAIVFEQARVLARSILNATIRVMMERHWLCAFAKFEGLTFQAQDNRFRVALR